MARWSDQFFCHTGAFMDWARILAYVTGTVDQEGGCPGLC